ncbi:hypothetical protein LXL04_037251 [Taraxacum kok-saghyz]
MALQRRPLGQSFIASSKPLKDPLVYPIVLKVDASNKVKPLLTGVPNQSMVESVDDEKVIPIFFLYLRSMKPLKALVQVNTIGETSKFGVDPDGCLELTLPNCKSEVCNALGIPEEQCQLSMGMSSDFELAIEMGSTNVRIGSAIFGRDI